MADMTTNIGIIRTKLHRPQLTHDLVPRRQLLERLESCRRRSLTLVSAPAGYGKSTLVSHWLELSDCPCAWVSLDEEDNDLRRFLMYLSAAIQTLFPQALQDTLALATTHELPPLSALVRSLLNELDRIEPAFLLVLDDYHLIHEPAIHTLLAELTRHPPGSLLLVVITRKDPTLPLSALRAKDRIIEIRARDLRFSATETAAFLQNVLGTSTDETSAAQVLEKTEGWITGLRLVSLSLGQNRNVEQMLKTLPEDSHYITNYLLAEVLTQQAPAVRNFLLQTAILNRFCAPLCEMVRPGTEACEIGGQEFIAFLKETGLFIIPLDEQQQWFRYHHMFQKFLLYRLRELYSQAEIAALHTRAGAWLVQHDLIEEALHHLLAAGNNTGAAELVERHRHTPMNEDKWYILEKWLSRLPDDIIQQRPGLLMARAWVSNFQGAFWAIPPILQKLESFIDPEDTTAQGLWGELDFFKGICSFWEGQGERSMKLLRHALERIPQAHIGVRNSAEIYFGVASQSAGQGETIVQSYQKMLYHERSESTRKGRLLGTLIFIHLLSGNLFQAHDASRQLLDMVASTNNSYLDAWGLYLLAHANYRWNKLETACDYFAQAVGKRYFLNMTAPFDSYAGLIFSYQAIQQAGKADDTIKLMLEYGRQAENPDYVALVRSCQARLSLLQGDVESAGQWLETVDLSSDTGTTLFWLEVPRITQCRVLLAQSSEDSLREATEKLRKHWQFSRATHNTPHMIEISLLQALAYQKQGQHDEALAAVERAVTLARPGGWVRPFVELGPEMASLLKCLNARENIAAEYISQLLDAFKDEEPGAAPDVSAHDTPTHLSPHNQALLDPLTKRETEILTLLAQRLTNREIAEKLFIAPGTVKLHTIKIYRKLGAHSRREAVAKAGEIGLLA